MKWLILFVVGLAAGDSQNELADKIVTTEQECNRLFRLNGHWNSKNFNDQAFLYVDLFFLCHDYLAEEKYAYIDKNHVDMSQYTGDDAKFPVLTSTGEEWVSKPPQRSEEDVATMKEKLADFLKKEVDKNNPLNKLTNIQSTLGQKMIDQQVSCEILALIVLKHPDDKEIEVQHAACLDKLYCIKEKFMKQHGFDINDYPEFFPILYKGRGTMINSPPHADQSLCVSTVHPSHYKKELEKWSVNVKSAVKTVEKAAEEKLNEFQEVGTDLIEKLKHIGMFGGAPVLGREQLDTLMTNVKSVTVMDDDEDDEHPNSNIRTYQVYGNDLLEKLAELEARGLEIANVNNLANVASSTNDKLKKEAQKIKPAIKKTMKGLSDVESQVKQKSKSALGEVKGATAFADDMRKMTGMKIKEDSSIILDKLTSTFHSNTDSEEDESDNEDEADENPSWFKSITDKLSRPEYLPKNFDNMPKPSIFKLLKEMGRSGEEDNEGPSDEELLHMLNAMKAEVKKKATEYNVKEEEVKQAAAVLKNIMHSVLNAAKYGEGAAKGMAPEEIEKAKSLVNKVVDFATGEIVSANSEDHGGHVVKKDNVDLLSAETADNTKAVAKKDVSPTTSQDDVSHIEDKSDDKNETPTAEADW